MSTIVTRAGKGSPLTNTEVDSNFTNLNTDKVETLSSADGSIVITGTGASIDLSVSQNSPASVLLEQVRNSTGATLTKGTAVYISGATGQLPTVSKALATGDSTSAQTLGLINSDLANNANGYVTIIGLISNINTSAYTDGAQLYLSPTTAGTLTATKPYAPQHLVYVAVVAHAHPTQGKLLVKVQNGYEMDELHNVSAQSPTNGDTLVYNSTTTLWTKTAQSTLSVASAAAVPFSGVTSKPTTLSGYGITDALPLAGGTLTGKLTLDGRNEVYGVPTNAGTIAGFMGGTSGGTTAARTQSLNTQTLLNIAALGYTGSAWVGGAGLSFVATENQAAGTRGTKAVLSAITTGDSTATTMEFNGSALTINGSTAVTSSNYTTYAPTLTGTGASGTWGISITGSAGSAGSASSATVAARLQYADGPRDLSDRLPNTFTRTVVFDFVGAGTGNGSGNYAGVMTYSPWTGTSASTGDSSYQLSFANTTGVNASGQPKLSIRNGIDSTWNAWYVLLHSGNYNSYAPTLTGGGASGTWGINISGNAATATSSTTATTATTATNLSGGTVAATTGSFSGALTVTATMGDGNAPFRIAPSSSSGTFQWASTAISASLGAGQTMIQILGNALSTGNSGYLGYNYTSSNSASNFTSLGFYGNDNILRVYNGIYTQSLGSMRAPIFYDSDNTAYYADLNSAGTSLNAAGNLVYGQGGANTGSFIYHGAGAGDYGVIRFYQAGSNNQTIHAFGTAWQSGTLQSTSAGSINIHGANGVTFGGWNNNDMWIDTSGNSQSRTSSRAPIFYDSNDTGYYLDPASSTTSLKVGGALTQGSLLSRPYAVWGASGDSTGAVVIKLPGSSGNYGMIHAVIDIYEYSGNNVSTIIIGGHNWGSAWHNIGANVTGYTNKPVRLCFVGGQYAIVIGNDSSTWSYGQVVLRKIQNGSYYSGVMDLGGTYTSYLTTSVGASWDSGDINTFRSTTITGLGSVRAPIFYDSDNTACYVDPASTSILNTIGFNGTSANAFGNYWAGGAGYPAYQFSGGNSRFGFSSTAGVVDVYADGNFYATDNGYLVLHTANYNSYSPTLTGTGASGTWAINISGNAATATTLQTNGTVSFTTDISGFHVINAEGTGSNLRLGSAWDKPGIYNGSGTTAGGAAGSITIGSENSIYFTTQNVQRGRFDSSGIGYASASFRAPIFYDSDNTAYFVNPTSNSLLSSLAVDFDFRAAFASGVGGTTFSSSHYSMGKDTANGSWSHPHYSDLIIGYHTGIRLGAAYSGIRFYNNSPTTDANNDGNGDVGEALLMTVGGYVGNSGQDVNVNNSLYAGASMRAPIFYDSNDTTYYGDFNNTGVSIKTAGSIQGTYYVASNYTTTGYTQYKGYDNNNHFIVVRGYVSGTTTTPTITGGHGTTFVEYAEANDTTGWFFRTSETGNYDVVSRITRSYSHFNSSVRSPLFYDSDNTAYYTDPASTSNLNQVNLQGYLRRNTSAAGYLEGNYATSIDSNSSACIYTIGGSHQPTSTTMGNMYGIGYTVGNGTANPGLGMTGWGLYVASGGTSRIFLDSDSGTGIATTSWRAPLFYDRDNTAYYGDFASTSVLNQLELTGANHHYLYINPGNGYEAMVRYNGGTGSSWYVGKRTASDLVGTESFHFYSEVAIRTVAGIDTAGNTFAYGSSRAPLFYDSGNTAYYTDPASTSVLNGVTANTLTGPINGMPNNGNAISGMGSATTWDARPGPVYDRYAINWHTGISLSGYPGYGGVRLYSAGYPTQANAVLRLEASSGVYTYGNFTNDTRVDAPIFYDSNNTAYYTDPAGTSSLNRISTVRTDNWLYIDSNYGHSVVGAYNSYRYQGVFAMGDSYKLPADGTTTGSLYGMAWSHPNAGGAAGNLTDHGLLIINNGGFRCAISNSIVASANITAYSDERLKTNWRDMPEDYVTRLAQVKVGIYDRIDQEDVTQVGVSAQSFQELLPQAIMTAKDEMQTLSVSYGNAALASAVELAKEVVDLRNRVAHLESLIHNLIGD